MAEKSVAAASGATRKKKSRQSKDHNIDEIKKRARDDAIKQVQAEMNDLKKKASEMDEMKLKLEAALTEVQQLKAQKASAVASAMTHKTNFDSLKQAIVSHDKAHKLSRDEDGVWIFTPRPTGHRLSPGLAQVSNATESPSVGVPAVPANAFP